MRRGVLFKRFADIDVTTSKSTPRPRRHHPLLRCSLTVGGINLEDIKAPMCFEIEQTLQERLDIPVFHDDQHGDGIIAAPGSSTP